MGNDASLKMFDKLGFKEKTRSEVFKEITLEVSAQEEKWRDFILEQTRGRLIKDYEHK